MTWKQVQFRLEAALVRVALAVVRALPPVAASNLGGAVTRIIGPLLPVSRVADRNLRLALPDLDAAARRQVIRGVWDNLGRTVAELPHLARLREPGPGAGSITEGIAVLDAVREAGEPAIFFSGHLANWELQLPAAAAHGVYLAPMYRAAANPLVDEILNDLRRAANGPDVPMFAKGALGARAAIAYLRRGGVLGMLVDQKMNDGISVPFFGHPAMTARAAAAMALRFGCKLVPSYVERLGPARFRVIFEPPLALPDTGDRLADVELLTTAMNACLERWIRARPDTWLWLHRRWPKELYT